VIVLRIVQFVKIVQLVQLNYYGYIKFFVGICRYMGWSVYQEHLRNGVTNVKNRL